MAGEIQLNSTTMATESSGSITAQLDTIRPNTTNGSLTLQGDSSDAGVTGLTIDSSGNANFPNGFSVQKGIFNFQKSIVTGASLTTTTLPFEATPYGSHAHQFKTTDAQVVIMCVSRTRLYEDSAASGTHDLNGVFALRHSLDSYASNLNTNGLRILDYGHATYSNKILAGSVVFQWIYTPTRSVNDTITYKIYMTSNTNVYSITTDSDSIWTSYEVGV